MANMSLRRRTAMRGAGSAIDWERIARGLLSGMLSGDITLPNDITLLRNHAFSVMADQYALLSVTAPNMVDIGNYAFESNMGLLTVNFGSLNSIGVCAFTNCRALQSPIILSNSATTLGNMAFYGCWKIPYVDVGAGVTSIGSQCFRYNNYMQYVIMRPTSPPTLGTNNFINANTDYPIYVPDASVATYKAKSGWSSLASRIFPLSDIEP